jgi:hypothetical protein
VDVGPDSGVVDLNAPLAFKIYGHPSAVNYGLWTADFLGFEIPTELQDIIGDL